MPLNFINESTGAAFVRFSVEDNEWLRSSEGGNLVEFDPSKGVVIDIENIQLGWLKLSGGRDWVEWPDNDPTNTPKPSDAHKQAFSVKLYSTKLFDDEPVRELCTSQQGMMMFIKKLHEEAENSGKMGKGEVPAVAIGKSKEKLKIGAGSTRVPPFEIVKWVDRPDELAGDAPAPAAKAPEPDTSSTQGADDDVEFSI